MIAFGVDENSDGNLVNAFQRCCRGVDLVRVQDAGLSSAPDPAALEWAVREGRVLLTHDAATMIDVARQRVAAGRPMPGVIVVRCHAAAARVVEGLELSAACAHPGELAGSVWFLPL